MPIQYPFGRRSRSSGVVDLAVFAGSGPPSTPTIAHSIASRALPKGVPRACAGRIRAATLDLWQDLCRTLSSGLRVATAKGVTRVDLLGQVQILVSADGVPSIPDAPSELRRFHPGHLDLGRPLQTPGLIEAVLRRQPDQRPVIRDSLVTSLLAESRIDATGNAFHARVESLAETVLAWMQNTVAAMAHRWLDGRAIERRITETLRIDSALILLARRTRPYPTCNADLRLDWLCRVARLGGQFRGIQAWVPSSLRAVGVLVDQGKLAPDRLSIPGFATALRALGASKAERRRLLGDPARPVWRLYDEGLASDAGVALNILVHWGRLHAPLLPDQSMTSRMWRMVMLTVREPISGKLVDAPEWRLPPLPLAATIRAARRDADRGGSPEFTQREWPLVAVWAAGLPNPDALAKRGSWRKLVREARDEDRRRKAQAMEREQGPWASHLRQYRRGAYEAILVESPTQLVEEAIRMRHCVDSYAGICKLGRSRAFRILRHDCSGQTQVVATLLLRSTRSRWLIRDCGGFANSPIGPGLLHFAEHLAEACNEAGKTAEATVDASPAEATEAAIASPVAQPIRKLRLDARGWLLEPGAGWAPAPTRAEYNGWNLDTDEGMGEALEAYCKYNGLDEDELLLDADDEGVDPHGMVEDWAQGQVPMEELDFQTASMLRSPHSAGFELMHALEDAGISLPAGLALFEQDGEMPGSTVVGVRLRGDPARLDALLVQAGIPFRIEHETKKKPLKEIHHDRDHPPLRAGSRLRPHRPHRPVSQGHPDSLPLPPCRRGQPGHGA